MTQRATRLNCSNVTASYSAGSVLGGRYVLEERLGDGGMAEVWQAKHLALGMRVAVKLLHHERPSRVPGARERFLTEAKVMARLATRRVVSVQDFGITRDGAPYLVMGAGRRRDAGAEAGPRGSHRARRRRRARAGSGGARARSRPRAQASSTATSSPNVLLTLDEDGALIAKVADFGVAKLLGDARESELIGTPAYMAPEQLRDTTSISTLTDVWAFGVVAFELLTGRLPFTGRDLQPSVHADRERRPREGDVARAIASAVVRRVVRAGVRARARGPLSHDPRRGGGARRRAR